MSTYLTAEAALLDLLRAYDSGDTFTTANSSIEDWLVLTSQGSEVAAIVEMAGETVEGDNLNGRGSQGMYQEQHTIGIWICVKRGTGEGGDGAIKQTLKTLTESVKDYLRPYEQLDNTVAQAQIIRTSTPALIAPTNNPTQATHIAQQIILQVLCESDRDPLEYAE